MLPWKRRVVVIFKNKTKNVDKLNARMSEVKM